MIRMLRNGKKGSSYQELGLPSSTHTAHHIHQLAHIGHLAAGTQPRRHPHSTATHLAQHLLNGCHPTGRAQLLLHRRREHPLFFF
jgi:hypothetical protein